jgi:hypothetical protein
MPIDTPEALHEHAKSTVETLALHTRSIAEQKVIIDRLSADLSAAQKVIAERAAADAAPRLTDSDRDLSRYVVDGQIVARSFDKGDARVRARSLPGFLDSRPTHPQQAAFCDALERHTIAITALHGAQALNDPDMMVRGCRPTYEGVQAAFRTLPEGIRRAFDTATGSGGDFIPVPLLASPMWQIEEFDPDGLLSIFPETPMTSASLEIPLGTSYPVPRKLAGQTGDTPARFPLSSTGTDKLTVTASGMVVAVLLHEDATEDSIVPAIPFIRESMARSMAIGERLCVINGDTATTHGDTGISSWDPAGVFGAVPDSSDHYLRSWLGLRQLALDQSNGVDRSTFSLQTFAADIAAVQGPRGGRGDMVLLSSWQAYVGKLVSLTGVVSASDYGSNAPIVRGEVASIYGVPIILTDALTADMNASGIYDNVTTTKSGMLLLNRQLYRRFSRVGTVMDLQRDIMQAGTYLRARNRKTYQNMAKSGQKTVRYLYNL